MDAGTEGGSQQDTERETGWYRGRRGKVITRRNNARFRDGKRREDDEQRSWKEKQRNTSEQVISCGKTKGTNMTNSSLYGFMSSHKIIIDNKERVWWVNREVEEKKEPNERKEVEEKKGVGMWLVWLKGRKERDAVEGERVNEINTITMISLTERPLASLSI